MLSAVCGGALLTDEEREELDTTLEDELELTAGHTTGVMTSGGVTASASWAKAPAVLWATDPLSQGNEGPVWSGRRIEADWPGASVPTKQRTPVPPFGNVTSPQ